MLTGPRTPRLAVAAAAVALLLAGCGDGDGKAEPKPKPKPSPEAKETPRPGDQRVTLTWKGKKRVYAVHAPPSYTPGAKLPLVIAMHPYPSDGTYVAQLTGLNAKADKEGFLVAYPDGLDQAYNALICCGAEDDVGFISEMTKRLLNTWQADPDRVYATGISNGADMAYRLAVELPGTLAAIAPVSGGYGGSAAEDAAYMPKSPVHVATFVGGLDKNYNLMEIGLKTWHKRLECEAGPAVRLKDKVTRTTAKCRDSSEFVTYRLPDMGHNWPGSEDLTMGAPTAGVNATDVIWEFFKGHPRKSP
ncbi:PHB depolymerase family esterase [Streptomyces sp. NPDC051907]|uniref:alpha/beta hydrolase family esterase n=1 Tax=Streptomyces sp. NPDC051907 TaxID=3155284 RepID=UPI003430B2F9